MAATPAVVLGAAEPRAVSVVNRMLQDIDRRLGATAIDAQRAGVRSVPERAKPGSFRVRTVWIALLSITAGVAAAVTWDQWRAPDRTEAPMRAVASNASAPVVVQASLIAAPAPAPAQAAVAPAIAADVVREPDPIAAPVAREPDPISTPSNAGRPAVESFKLALKLSSQAPVAAASPALARAAAPPPLSTARVEKAEVPVRLVAADETVSAARTMWIGGARAGALGTLREALAAAEASQNAAAVMPLARELARLEVADNRPQAAIELLKRMDPVFGADAEALALRGNAEQRLALHADAAQSYLAALRLRPGEGKWMLGAAISLAADGKRDEAQAWVDRARERGAITPAIGPYLQQLGIAPRP